MCENCKELCERFNIDYPYQLYSLVKELKELIRTGVIVYVKGNCELDDILPDKKWPGDIIDIKFQCATCSQNFHLFCDTYHGRGSWRHFLI